MSNISLGYHEISPNYGFYIDIIPQNVKNELKTQIDKLQSDFSKGQKWNDDLAGEIQHEYSLSPQPYIKQYIKELSQNFENNSQYLTTSLNPVPTLSFKHLWVNFQKKHEYNPLHDHDGVYSFVIWYQIPFTFENEKKYHYRSEKSYPCTHGSFSFVTPFFTQKNVTLKSYSLDIDKTKEGYAVIFPSNLFHTVYPFYSSNEYRITIAGNVTLK